MNIGTDEYDKWLSKYRKNTIIRERGLTKFVNQEASKWVSLLRSSWEKRPYSQKDSETQAYYKEMAKKQEEKKVEMRKQVMKRWKVFDEVSDLNDDMKEEILKFLY